MKSILKEFANGNITPAERSFKRGSEYDEAFDKVVKIQEQLNSKLGKDEIALLDEFMKAQGRLDCLEYASKFSYGFYLGLLMTAEAFFNSENLLTDGVDE
ncbi:MAG: hypothetical protein LBI03_08820 [Clostridiales bacterium]|nr:hypothetical protein [Clostridiales bacterium]